jgi:hypothetical protein
VIIAGRNRDYKEVAESLRAKKVLIITCNTCVRLCGNIGGRKAAEDLSEKLIGDGIEVTEVIDVSAACIAEKIRNKLTQSKIDASDVILALTCPLGASSIASVSGIDIFNPLETIGVGYLDEDGVPIVVSDSCDFSEETPADEAAEDEGLKISPFV